MLVLEGRAFLKRGVEICAIGIDDGRIVAIKKTLGGKERRDYGELLILPGGIDIHVHFREPGMTHKEDFESGSTSAGLGGVTTVFDMPNTLPPTITLRNYEEKLAAVRKKAFVDFGIYGGIASEREAARLAGVAPALKLYLAPTTGSPGVAVEDVPELLGHVPANGPPVIVHAEDPAKFGTAKARNLAEHNLSRPVDAESSSIKALRGIGREVHVTHVTSADGLEALSSSGFTSDVTPHHLLLNCSSRLGAHGKVNPPLRGPSDREVIWRAFAEGRIEMLASDHAPHTLEEKDVKFEDAPSGMPGVETMIPLLLRKVRSSDLPMETLVRAVSERPAGLIGLDKGSIAVGMDADLIVVDLRRVTRIKGRRLHSKCGWTAFEGWEGVFPVSVYLRGNLIADEGEVVEDLIGASVIRRKMEAREDIGALKGEKAKRHRSQARA